MQTPRTKLRRSESKSGTGVWWARGHSPVLGGGCHTASRTWTTLNGRCTTNTGPAAGVTRTLLSPWSMTGVRRAPAGIHVAWRRRRFTVCASPSSSGSHNVFSGTAEPPDGRTTEAAAIASRRHHLELQLSPHLVLAPNPALLLQPLHGVDVEAGEGVAEPSRVLDMAEIRQPLADLSPIARTGVVDDALAWRSRGVGRMS